MIKQQAYFWISMALLAAIVWFVVDRVVFLETAKRVMGSVTHISGSNSRCGGRHSHYDCTNFYADVSYKPEGQPAIYSINISAGTSRGHNQPVSQADYRYNQPVRVVYNPKRYTEAYEDTLMGVWGTPIMIFFFQITSLFTSFTEPRKRYSS